MKVKESFAVEATEEVRKDPRFDWYVNWLKSLENADLGIKEWFETKKSICYGISKLSKSKGCFYEYYFDVLITLDEVYSRYGKEIYEANGIEQPFQGSREYDEKLLGEFTIYLYEEYGIAISSNTVHFYLNKRYNSDLLKEKEQLEQRLKEINEQLK